MPDGVMISDRVALKKAKRRYNWKRTKEANDGSEGCWRIKATQRPARGSDGRVRVKKHNRLSVSSPESPIKCTRQVLPGAVLSGSLGRLL